MNVRSHLSRLLALTLPLLLALPFGGCGTFGKKKDKPKKPESELADQSGDVAFQGFLSRLRKAVDRHDRRALSGMMTANFGYSWEAGGEGPGVFDYWDKNGVWEEVGTVLRSKFIPHDRYMIAPAQQQRPSSQRPSAPPKAPADPDLDVEGDDIPF